MARILIAEDDSSMRHFLAMALQRAGHEVEACEDGLSALRVLDTDKNFDLLLADIVMPGMDGIELSQKASEICEKLKVMFITGFAAVAATSRMISIDSDSSSEKTASLIVRNSNPPTLETVPE